MKAIKSYKYVNKKVLAFALATAVTLGGFSLSHAQTQAPPATLSPNLQEVIKLTQAHMADDVIVAYIRNSGASYALSANDILYLNNQGVSQPVISALLQAKAAPDTGPAPSVAPSVPAPNFAPAAPPVAVSAPPVMSAAPAPEVNFDYFHSQMAPYGSWMDVPGFGMCFRPTESSLAGWRPYCDGGHWVYTDDGWFWQSDYPWGEIAFHYGRWLYTVNQGWLWVPGYDYAPAWVCWRNAEAEGYCGWAPLPPGAVYRAGVGIMFNGRLAADIDFGLNSTYFTFVPFDHFWDRDFRRYVAPRDYVGRFYHHSVVLNSYHMVGGRFIMEGLGHERIGRLTHHDVRSEHVTIRDPRISHGVIERSRGGGHDVRGEREVEHRGVEDRSRGGSRDDHR